MPLPSRQKELYEKVRQDLREKFSPGMTLPTEPAYACMLGCGRTTLRKVLTRLQEENLIRRTHRGTFVLDPAVPVPPEIPGTGKPEEERPLFMLIPCAQYTEKVGGSSLKIHHQVMTGAMRETINSGSHLVTLPVSETNKDNGVECIDFALSQIKSLRKGDKVIFFGRWFRRILPFLAEKECRIAYVSQMPAAFEEQIKGLNTAAAFTGYSTSAFITSGLEELKKRGKKFAGCLYFSLDEEEKNGVEKAFYCALAANGMQGILCTLSYRTSYMEKYSFITEFLAEKGNILDGLIVCPHLKTASHANPLPAVPPHILTVCEQGIRLENGDANHVLYIYDDLVCVAGILAKALLNDGKFPATPYPYKTEE